MRSYKPLIFLLLGMILVLGTTIAYLAYERERISTLPLKRNDTARGWVQQPTIPVDSTHVFSGTFLGNETRSFYGDSLPDSLLLQWKFQIGYGKTFVTVSRGMETWSGAGWTGQPLIVEESGHPFLIQGCYDHTLKKLDAITGELVWEYWFDDVLKGTGTIWVNDSAAEPRNRLIILQGSRRGNDKNLASDTVPSFRAISYFTGKELWRLNVKRGPSFSRDVDGSALVLKDTVYIGLENGYFSTFTAGWNDLVKGSDYYYKPILSEDSMFTQQDIARHGGELVIESSPARLGNHLYVTTGAGHVYGYNLVTRKIDWDFYVGSDMNGSAVVTKDSCLLVTVEKQFIKGPGGCFKLDPTKPADSCVVWYLPTGNRDFASWSGGVVGTAAVNDYYRPRQQTGLAAIAALDGFLYLVDHTATDTAMAEAPDGVSKYTQPVILDRFEMGPTISTPIFIKDKICVAGYTGIYLLEIKNKRLVLLSHFPGIFEATPVAYKGRVFVAGKNGWLYCLGGIPLS